MKTVDATTHGSKQRVEAAVRVVYDGSRATGIVAYADIGDIFCRFLGPLPKDINNASMDACINKLKTMMECLVNGCDAEIEWEVVG